MEGSGKRELESAEHEELQESLLTAPKRPKNVATNAALPSSEDPAAEARVGFEALSILRGIDVDDENELRKWCKTYRYHDVLALVTKQGPVKEFFDRFIYNDAERRNCFFGKLFMTSLTASPSQPPASSALFQKDRSTAAAENTTRESPKKTDADSAVDAVLGAAEAKESEGRNSEVLLQPNDMSCSDDDTGEEEKGTPIDKQDRQQVLSQSEENEKGVSPQHTPNHCETPDADSRPTNKSSRGDYHSIQQDRLHKDRDKETVSQLERHEVPEQQRNRMALQTVKDSARSAEQPPALAVPISPQNTVMKNRTLFEPSPIEDMTVRNDPPSIKPKQSQAVFSGKDEPSDGIRHLKKQLEAATNLRELDTAVTMLPLLCESSAEVSRETIAGIFDLLSSKANAVGVSESLLAAVQNTADYAEHQSSRNLILDYLEKLRVQKLSSDRLLGLSTVTAGVTARAITSATAAPVALFPHASPKGVTEQQSGEDNSNRAAITAASPVIASALTEAQNKIVPKNLPPIVDLLEFIHSNDWQKALLWLTRRNSKEALIAASEGESTRKSLSVIYTSDPETNALELLQQLEKRFVARKRKGVRNILLQFFADTEAVYWACSAARLDILSFLLQKGSSPNNASRSPLLAALSHGSSFTKGVLLLLGRGAKLNVADENGNNPLHIAAKTLLSDVLSSMVGLAPALVHQTNGRGATPLHLASLHLVKLGSLSMEETDGLRKMIKSLLAAGADQSVIEHNAAWQQLSRMTLLSDTQMINPLPADHFLTGKKKQQRKTSSASFAEDLTANGDDINDFHDNNEQNNLFSVSSGSGTTDWNKKAKGRQGATGRFDFNQESRAGRALDYPALKARSIERSADNYFNAPLERCPKKATKSEPLTSVDDTLAETAFLLLRHFFSAVKRRIAPAAETYYHDLQALLRRVNEHVGWTESEQKAMSASFSFVGDFSVFEEIERSAESQLKAVFAAVNTSLPQTTKKLSLQVFQEIMATVMGSAK